MSNARIASSLRSLHNNGVNISDKLSSLRKDVKEGLMKVADATEKVDKGTASNKETSWRVVKGPTVEDQYPLVRSDLESTMKKLNII